jgi:tetraacyldisaccharide 4'-kinase
VSLASWTDSLVRQWWQPKRTALTQGLRPLSWLYRGVSNLLRWTRHPQSLPVPVIVVGNLIVGGAGKTPTTLALIKHLQAAGWQPGVVSRGHGRQGQDVLAVSRQAGAALCGDEPLLIHLRSGVPVQVGADRVQAARALLARAPDVNLIVSDDGLQHSRLPRDLQVLVFDERGLGNGLCLPAGPLRQPWTAAVPVHSLVLYNAPRPSTPWPGFVAQRGLAGAVALDAWWQGQAPSLACLAELAQQSHKHPLLAAAGLAAPERFFAMLEQAGLHIQRLPLPDHAALRSLPWPAATPVLLVTEKDAVKLQPDRVGPTQVWVVALDFSLPAAFLQALAQAMPPLPPLPP